MHIIKNNRAISTTLACTLIPVITFFLIPAILSLFGMFFRLFKVDIQPVLVVVSPLIFILPAALFLLALVLPNLDMLDKRSVRMPTAMFYKPMLKSIAYYAAAGAGLVVSFYLIYIIPNFLYFLYYLC